ncbi:MAG: acyl-CoA thioesterase II [Hyphomicrobiales bacterium]
MTRAIVDLLAILDLETLEQNLFRGISPKVGWQRVFGGQVIGQALVAATSTVEDRLAHSLHAYFMRPGDPKVPIIYEVERIRDGGSFSTRRVVAIQHGRAIYSMSVSFHKTEPGFDHQDPMPEAPPPEDLPTEAEIKERYLTDETPEHIRRYWQRERPIEIRPEKLRYPGAPSQTDARQNVWMRATGKLPDDPALHQCVLAYATDFTLVDTSLIPHGTGVFDPKMQVASLDHAMWFHRPFRADDWLLYTQNSPSAAGARGLTCGSVFTRDGALVATVAQEGLIRQKTR